MQKILVYTLPLAVLIMMIMQFVLSNNLAAYSADMKRMQKDADDIAQENSLLEQQVAVAQSTETIQARASALGFMKPASYVSIPAVESVALNTR